MKHKNISAFTTAKALIVSVTIFSSFQPLNAQDDPYERMKIAAKAKPIYKSELPAVTVTTKSPVWKSVSRNPIQFKPIEMVDRNGRRIAPDEILTLYPAILPCFSCKN